MILFVLVIIEADFIWLEQVTLAISEEIVRCDSVGIYLPQKDGTFRGYAGKVPLVHHCAAGKDRTGVGAALIYLLLGVSEEAIIEEYLLTNEATAKKPPIWFTKMKE